MSIACAERLNLKHGPDGTPLAAILGYPDGACRGSVLIIGPHPLMGGRMDHPILTAVADAAADRGLASLRFEFAATHGPGADERIGASMAEFWRTGRAPEDASRSDEAETARTWLAEHAGPVLGIVGYSFGALLTLELANRRPAPAIGLIAPPFARLAMPTAPSDTDVRLALGTGDFAGHDDALKTWIDTIPDPGRCEIAWFDGGHFMRGHESAIASHLLAGGLS